MPRPNSNRGSVHLIVMIGLLIYAGGNNQTFALAQQSSTDNQAGHETDYDLQLEVIMNGTPSGWIAAFYQRPDGMLAIDPEQLRNIGLIPQKEAILADGKVDIARLRDVSFQYDKEEQTISFRAKQHALAPRKLDGGGRKTKQNNERKPESHLGALVNYTLYSSYDTTKFGSPWIFNGISGSFENRVFGPLGTLTSSQLVTFSPNDQYSTTRLDTTWSYWDPDRIISYHMGDVITGGLSWTRPVRLGGLQIQRNFSLRPDLVTMPLPELSGSAAVPSTVDVYINNTKRVSENIPAGPFQISDVPVVTGDATARMVVRDALGRETVTETPLYASASLLATGMIDYSVEVGFARRSYGTESFSYDALLVGSGTLRYGVTDRVTFEGHVEGGETFVNGGMALVAGLGQYGVGTFAGAWSGHQRGGGYLSSASVETTIWGVNLRASTQRTFGNYQDIASISSEKTIKYQGTAAASSGPAKALDQVTVSVPLDYQSTNLNFTFTNVETTKNDRSRIFSVSANRPVGEKGNLFVNVYADIEDSKSFGIYAGLSWSFGNNTTASTAMVSDADGTSVVSEIFTRKQNKNSTIDWRFRDSEGHQTSRAVAATYSDATTRSSARIEQSGNSLSVNGEAEGALVFIGGEAFATRQIDDAFAVIDTGNPGVEVEFENRPIGKTGRRGTLLIPDLRAYEGNTIRINPESLPIHASIGKTSEKIVPHKHSGVRVDFGVKTDVHSVVVILKRKDGNYVEAGSVVSLEDGSDNYIVGYDGQAYLTDVSGRARLVVSQTGFPSCRVEVDFGQRSAGRTEFGSLVCEDIQ